MQKRWTRFMSRVLVLLMMLQLISVGPIFSTTASADEDVTAQDETSESVSNDAQPAEEPGLEEAVVETVEEDYSEQSMVSVQAALPDGEVITLHNGTAIIPYNADTATVKAKLCAALIDNYDPSKDYSSLEWEYECAGKEKKLGLTSNTAWGDIAGFESHVTKKVGLISTTTDYTHPALSANNDASYAVRIKGDAGSAVTLTKVQKLSCGIELLDNNIKLCFADDDSVDYDAVRELIMSKLSTDPALGVGDVAIEYYAAASSGSIGSLGKAWVALEGGTVNGLSYPAMGAGTQKIKITYSGNDEYFGFEKEYDFNVAEGRTQSTITEKESAGYKLMYNDDATVNYDAVREQIFSQFETDPELSVADVEIKYYASANTGSIGSIGKAWVALEGGTVNGLSYPAMSAGEQKISISYSGNKDYLGFGEEFSISVATGREQAVLEFAADPSFKLVYNEDLSVDYSAAYQAVYELIEAKTPENISLEDLTIEYYATASTGAIGSAGKAWVALEGGKVDILTYPGIEEGTWDIRVSYPGSREYDPVSVTASVKVLGRPSVEFNTKEGPYEVGLVFADAAGYDYEATEKAIYDAVIESTTPELTYDDITVEYDASQTGYTKQYRPISADNGLYKAFGEGEWNIRFSWGGNREYKGGELVVTVTVKDNRIKSEIVYVDGAAITYNMDASVMEQAIFDNMIDWTNSTLPEKSTLSLADFTIEYYALRELEGGISGTDHKWVPIGGEEGLIGSFPKMGAADSQQVRISYHGNTEYRPQNDVEGTLTVNKANVKVKVHSATIHAGEAVPAGIVTTDPADEFDIYTIYAGITSNVTSSIYVDLPARFSNSAFLKVVDPIVAALNGGKSLSDMLNEGTTVGELRELLNASGIIEALDKVGIDTGTFGQIISVIDKLPGVADNMRIAFGTPKHAGIYTVTAVTDNPNYNTGYGVGALVVLKNVKGTKLSWNQEISGGKLTVEQAKVLDWGVTLTLNGEKVAKEDMNVHFLYSGFTSKWKPYSSTTVPPTEPGRYVVTVVTLGGDYLAAPITRTFQITK